jgi:CheY-like chemotaxis protein
VTSIVVVEDDYLQRDWISSLLQREFPRMNPELVRSESEFRQRLDHWRTDPPAVFVIDVMLCWAQPSRNIPDPPEEVIQDGFYTAGLRCQALLGANERLRNIPVLLYTILDRGDLEKGMERWPAGVAHIKKGDSESRLLEWIRVNQRKRRD